MLRGTLLIRRLAPAAVCALAVAACGSTQRPAVTTSATTSTTKTAYSNKTVAIYSSLPDSGADAARSHQIEVGIRFALSRVDGKAGGFEVKYHQLCDASVPKHRSHTPTSRGKVSTASHTSSRKCTGNWSQAHVVKNAEMAAGNPETIGYIGDLNSGATALSLPILNQAGIVQITPGSGYPGLTNSVKSPKGLRITQPSEPGEYYPRGLDNRTLLRLIPNDLVQASAALDVLAKAGCQKFSAWNFGTDFASSSLLNAVIATASKYKMVYSPAPPLSAKTNYITYARALAPSGIHCAVLVGHVTKPAEALTLELREQLGPSFTTVGSDGFCNAGWVRGIPSIDRKIVAEELYCVTPALPVTVKNYEGSAAFMRMFRKTYERAPTAYNLYGYAATAMLLRALVEPDSSTDIRARVLTNMAYDYAPNDVGTFSFDSDGNLLTNDDYGVDEFRGGVPRYHETVGIDSTHLLSSG